MTTRTFAAALLAALLGIPLTAYTQATQPELKRPPDEQGAKEPRAKPHPRKPGAGPDKSGDSAQLAVRPEQSSAERTADPNPLKHDRPTGEPTGATKR